MEISVESGFGVNPIRADAGKGNRRNWLFVAVQNEICIHYSGEKIRRPGAPGAAAGATTRER